MTQQVPKVRIAYIVTLIYEENQVWDEFRSVGETGTDGYLLEQVNYLLVLW